MRHWSTDGSIGADTRYSRLTRWAFSTRWCPMWLVALIWKIERR